MKPLHIAHIAPYYYPSVGGVEYTVQHLAESLSARGHQVDVLTTLRSNQPHKRPLMRSIDRLNGANVYRYPSWMSVGHMSFFPGIWRRLAREHYEIVHMHALRHPHTLIGLLSALRHRSAAVLQGHSHFIAGLPVKNLIYKCFDALVFPTCYRKLAAVVALTRSEKEGFIQRRIRPSQIEVIPNAVREPFFHPQDPSSFQEKHRLDGKKVLLFLGRIVPDKRVDLIIRALPDVVNQVPSAVFVAAGPQQENCRRYIRLASDLGVGDRVRFVGELDEDEKRQALTAADVFVLASDYEAFGLGIAEAMAAGKPVIATRTPGPMEIVRNGTTGLLVDRNSPAAIAEKAILLLQHIGFARALGEAGRRHALEKFSPQKVILQVEHLYYRLAAQRAARFAGRFKI
jgi:glycosyltransferase involved in cell wall biosynthesis